MWLLVLLALFLCCWQLGGLYLYDYDEAWNAQIAHEMVAGGDWAHLHWQGQPFWDKPPLFFWLMALSFRLLGEGEWQARLPAALATVACVLLTYSLGRRLGGGDRPGWVAGLLLLCSLPFVQTGRQAMLDVPLTTCLLLAAWGWQPGPAAMWLGIGLGAGLLTKGAAALLVVPILAVFGAWNRSGPGVRNPYLYLGLLLGLAPPAAWYALQGKQYGSPFFAAHLGYHVWQRATAAIEGHAGPWWYYLWELGARHWPWLILLPHALVMGNRRTVAAPLFRLGVAWSGCVLLAFSCIQTRLPWYLTPIYPGLAMVGAAAWAEEERPSFSLRLALGAGALLLAGAALVYGWLFGPPLPLSSLLPWRNEYVPLLAGLALAMAAAAASRRWLAVLVGATCVAQLALSWPGLMDAIFPPRQPPGWFGPWAQQAPQWIPMERPADPRPVGSLVSEQVPAGHQVLFLWPFARPALSYYARRPVVQVGKEVLARDWPGMRYALVQGAECESWRQRLPGSAILGRAGQGSGDFCLLGPAPASTGGGLRFNGAPALPPKPQR